ncbi:hypothetical protein ACFFX1_45855 [Dactylosporangium sucinum]|uniref:ARPP-2 domain-containing protein n=1 Tax=Dactylosporangium sucinum TaxID=1424081 RepID=UPI0035714FFE
MLTGLTPAQTWGAVRLVPLLRERPMPGLRLHRELSQVDCDYEYVPGPPRPPPVDAGRPRVEPGRDGYRPRHRPGRGGPAAGARRLRPFAAAGG